MATNLLRVGTELQLNQAPNVLFNQLQSDVSAMTDGGFFVAYESQGTNTTDVAGRFVNANATLGAHSSGNTGPVNDDGFHEGPAVTARPGGAAFVAWGDSFSGDVEYTAIGANGTNQITSGPNTGGHVNLDEDDSNSRPDAATFADGGIILVYQWVVSGADSDINAKVIPASGLAFTPATVLRLDATQSLSQSPAVAASGSRALIAYADKRDDGNAGTTDNFDIRVALFDKGVGTAPGSVTARNGAVPIADKAADLGNVDVAALKDGRYVVVYEDTVNNDIYARFVKADGNAVGGEIIIAKTSSGESMPRVAALQDGGFVVSWDQRTNGVDDVMARRFLSDGTPGGDRFRVNAEAGNASGSSIAANKDGKVFISYTSKAPAGDGEGSSVRGGLFQVTNQPLNGSANPDTIAAYNLGETISGLGGDDTIDARGGDDTVDGNEGKDTLTGGPGADTFVFSAKLKKANVDHITDFTPGTDNIQINASVFKKMGPGDLARKAFFAKKNADSAKDKKDRIIYDTKSGELYFDKDGKGGKGGKLFAILDGRPNVDHGDIVVVA